MPRSIKMIRLLRTPVNECVFNMLGFLNGLMMISVAGRVEKQSHTEAEIFKQLRK